MCQRRRCLRYGLVSLISVLLGKIIIQLYPLFSLANIFQVNINPAAFDSPDKHSQSEDEDSIPPETPCSDLPPQTSTECFANVTFINQNSYPPMKPNSAPLPINTCRSPPLTISFQDSTLNVTSSTNAMGMLPITSPIAATPAVSHAINLHLQSPIAISAASSSEPITPTSSPMVSTTLNSAVKLRMVGEGNSPYESPFTTPLKNGLTSPFANDLLNSHQRFHKNDQSHFSASPAEEFSSLTNVTPIPTSASLRPQRTTDSPSPLHRTPPNAHRYSPCSPPPISSQLIRSALITLPLPTTLALPVTYPITLLPTS